MEINLSDYKKSNIKVLSGRDKGEALRTKLNLTAIDKNKEEVIVNIPDEIYSLNSSYFLGLFGDSVRCLGEEEFKNKYKFKCDEIIYKNIENGISDALKDSDVLE